MNPSTSERNAAACGYFMQSHNRPVHDALAYGLADGFLSTFTPDHSGTDRAAYRESPLHLLRALCSNTGFFHNHFLATGGDDFIAHVHENMHVKRYPFIMAVDLPPEPGLAAVPHLVSSYDPISRTLELGCGATPKRLDCAELAVRVDRHAAALRARIEWLIFLPPKRTLKLNLILRPLIARALGGEGSDGSGRGLSAFHAAWAAVGAGRPLDAGSIGVLGGVAAQRRLWADFLAECGRRLENTRLANMACSWLDLVPAFAEAAEPLCDAADSPAAKRINTLVQREQGLMAGLRRLIRPDGLPAMAEASHE